MYDALILAKQQALESALEFFLVSVSVQGAEGKP